jgi:P4 family phage/plasmid primase-like protien
MNTTILNERAIKPTTANEAACLVFPEIGKHFDAFWEQDTSTLNEPTKLKILDLNDEFWALTIGPLGTPRNPTVYDQTQFRRYNPTKGIYEPLSESAVFGAILGNLELCAGFLPANLKFAGFLALKNRARLKSVVERAKDLLAVDDAYFKDRQHLHLALQNGVLQIDTKQFHPSDPNRPVRETLPVKYDPEAKAALFLKMFLAHILEPEDIDLLQRYLSQLLEGINHSQTILILTGSSGWGKSCLLKILGSMIGWNRVGIIREQLFRDEFELGHYAKKHLLYHPDMPTDFLDRKEASIFKQLCGGDPLWANTKADGRLVLEGNFPLVLACNGKPKIHLDQDSDAWMRRLVVLSFKKPNHDQHIGKMGELILKNEGPGILNWLLEGRAKLLKDKLQLTQTQEQKARAVNLLLGSESPAAFVRGCLVKKKDGVMGAADVYEEYQVWCKSHQLAPFSSKQFSQVAKAEIEIGFGLKCRHDLVSDGGGVMRGWKGLAMGEPAVDKNASKESGT